MSLLATADLAILAHSTNFLSTLPHTHTPLQHIHTPTPVPKNNHHVLVVEASMGAKQVLSVCGSILVVRSQRLVEPGFMTFDSIRLNEKKTFL